MDPNPYEAPRIPGEHVPHRGMPDVGSFLAAIAWFCGSTIATGWAGAIVGFLIMNSLPRESQPACGNTILDPAFAAGAMVGMLVGLVFAWRTLFGRRSCRKPSDEADW